MSNTKKLEQYADYLSEAELSGNTKEVYIRQAKVFLNFLEERPLTKKDLLAYKEYLLDKGYKRTTHNLYIVAVNNYLKYLERGDILLKTERLQKRRCPENVITKEEYNKMLDYARESGRNKYYCILRMLALTGIRVGELSDCTVESLEKGIFVTSNKGKEREVYLPDKLVRELREYCVSQNIVKGVIFRGSSGKAIERTSVYRMLIYFAEMAGVPKEKAHPHSFRHLFAITYMELYANLFELADILGHSSLETTRIYTATTSEAKRKKLDKLNL